MMKFNLLFTLSAACLLTFMACQQGSETPADLAKIKSEIQTAENAWADALNTKNLDALMALYTDDAVSMANHAPMLTGKDAIRKGQEQEFARTPDGMAFSFEVLDVYAHGNTVTETGKSTYKDADGKVVGTGKYMVVWEKQGDKYLCAREIYNNDSPPGPAGFKSIHLLDLPQDVTEADLAAALKKINTAIDGMGYPGAGYFLYKAQGDEVKDNRYFFEGVWPNEAAYKAIHDTEAWKKAAEETDALYQKISAVELYRKMVRVQ